jgi:hypothetical protein
MHPNIAEWIMLSCNSRCRRAAAAERAKKQLEMAKRISAAIGKAHS